MSISASQVALMPRLDRITSSSSEIMWVQWSSAPFNLSRVSRAFLTIGFVVEQIDRAIRTSPSLR